MISKLQVWLKSLCAKDYRNLNYMVIWCIDWRRLLAFINFQRCLLKYFPIIKILAVTLMHCNRLHAWWSTQSLWVTLLPSLFACRWVGLQTLWRLSLKDLSIDEMVGAWCFGCCQALRGLPVGFLKFCFGFQLYVLMSPCLCFISFLYLDLDVLGDDA